MEKMYLVKYDVGNWEEYYEVMLFVTGDLSLAEGYINRFNDLLERYRDFYRLVEGEDGDFCDEGRNEDYFGRWKFLWSIGVCYWEEVEVR